MSKLVVILGAGASAPFGVPTLRNIFKDPEARAYLATNSSLRKRLRQVIWTPRGRTLETSDETLTVEEILTLLRDSEKEQFGLASLMSADELAELRRGLYVLIKKAVYDQKSSSRAALNRIIFFADKHFDEVTWASFNWDCIFEASFYYWSGTDYTNRRNPRLVVPVTGWVAKANEKHTFLKLHGGINWWQDDEGLIYLPFGQQPHLNARWASYEDDSATGHPVILEPSYYKYNDPVYQQLAPQWDQFVTDLSGADAVVVIGYSLPDADSEARTAITLGFQNNENSNWLVIDQSEQTCARYAHLLGVARVTVFPTPIEQLNRSKDFESTLLSALEGAS